MSEPLLYKTDDRSEHARRTAAIEATRVSLRDVSFPRDLMLNERGLGGGLLSEHAAHIQIEKCLAARDWNVEKAADLCRSIFQWRRSDAGTVTGGFGADHLRLLPVSDKLIQGYREGELLRHHGVHRRNEPRLEGYIRETYKEYSGNWHKWDKRGHPAYFERSGLINAKKMWDLMTRGGAESGWDTMQGAFRFHTYMQELGVLLCRHQSYTLGRPISQVHVVLDLQNLSLYNSYHGPTLELLKQMTHIDQNFYPEHCYKISVVNCPRIVSVFWAIVKPILNSRSRSKIIFVDSKSTAAHLAVEFDDRDLPDFLGGSCRCPGGCVPKPTSSKV